MRHATPDRRLPADTHDSQVLPALRTLRGMEWDDFVTAARAISWVCYIGTTGADGRPHVAVVAPGFTEETLWFATRTQTRKLRNIRENPSVSFHWPVGGEGPGELFARGVALIRGTDDERAHLWEAGVLDYDPSGFFGSPDNAEFAFVEVSIGYARLTGPDFQRRIWRPTA